MPDQFGPKDLQDLVHVGFKRTSRFRKARLQFIKSFCGAYYDKEYGQFGEEPFNLVFNAIRSIIPQIVMNNPKHHVQSEYLNYRDYSEMLQKEMDLNAQQLNLAKIYRRWIVDALFTMGILKTGLAGSDSVISVDDESMLDPGMLYTDNVDFDNFVFDPRHTGPIEEAPFMGDRIRVRRDVLLESGLYNNELVERLPKVTQTEHRDGVEGLSKKQASTGDLTPTDEVEIVELYVSESNTIVTVPGSKNTSYDDYLRIEDYYGPKEGPYTFLSFTPPVPNNPLPVSYVGIWYDLHLAANDMMKKIIDQGLRQKDIVAYRGTAADDAQEALDARDGEAIRVDDPQGINTLSFGGQNRGNDELVGRLSMWYNMMAQNPQGMAGQKMDAKSATEAQILSQNTSVGLEDMKNLVYQGAAEEGRKRLFYLHTDPLKETPIMVRRPEPTPNGSVMVDRQITLTPEARRGEWVDYNLSIQPESMARVDANSRMRRAMEFVSSVMPAAAQAAQVAFMLGTPFNYARFISNMARELGVEWLDECLYDPQFQQQLAMRMQMGPDIVASMGQMAAPSQAPMATTSGQGGPTGQGGQQGISGEVGQNGRVGRPTRLEQSQSQQQQEGANEAQGDLKMGQLFGAMG